MTDLEPISAPAPRSWFRGKWHSICEVCRGPLGRATGEVGAMLACAACVRASRRPELDGIRAKAYADHEYRMAEKAKQTAPERAQARLASIREKLK